MAYFSWPVCVPAILAISLLVLGLGLVRAGVQAGTHECIAAEGE